MLTAAKVLNYQAIEKADLPLSPFTVIVGASNSGKSAFLRAIRTLAANTSSQGFVRVGSKQALVQVVTDDHQIISLERGPALSTYTVAIPDGTEQKYAKAGVTVPSDVADVLALPAIEGDSLNFAFQFDRPFLLDAPGTKVAKVLGDLTNITVLHEAVREANRRRLDASGKLKVRRADEKDLDARLDAYRELPAEKRRLEKAATLLAKAQDVEAQRDRILNLIQEVTLIEVRLSELRARASVAPTVDFTVLDAQMARLSGLRKTLTDITTLATDRQKALGRQQRLSDEAERLQADVEQRLKDEGVCPLCGTAR